MGLRQLGDATDAVEAIDPAKAFVERGSEIIGSHLSNILVSGFNKSDKTRVTGQLADVAWLRQQPWVDCAHIGVFGWSYGGYMSLMLLATASDRIAAGVTVAPVTDWTLYDTHYTERHLDTLQHNPQGYELSVVPHWLGDRKSSLRLVHGMANAKVLLANSTKPTARVEQRGVQFHLMTYPGAKHGLSTPH